MSASEQATTSESATEARRDRDVAKRLWILAYRAFGYVGLVSVFSALLYGFRYDAAAPPANIVWNVLLYAAFIAPHLIMTRSWYKRAVVGDPGGSPGERRVYILFTLVTWYALLIVHRPMPGFEIVWPAALGDVVPFAGIAGFLLCFLMFFQGSTFAAFDGMLAVPGAAQTYSHGTETPLFTEGPYAEVRHPMYRASTLAAGAAFLVHPNFAQLLWSVMMGATFLAFIPIEEAQLLAARGDEYRRYMERTPWRLFRGLW